MAEGEFVKRSFAMSFLKPSSHLEISNLKDRRRMKKQRRVSSERRERQAPRKK